ncbi:MAG TPA: hemerythrin domain-containing protein [Acidimicrobiia bacterium]|nr:hemerythrin domain-containing protein [Acidimicrobiia bacterium]
MALADGARHDDVVDLIKGQHGQVKSLFATLRTANGKAATKAFDDLRAMLAVHETAEEEIIYPALRGLGFDDIVEARLAEEDEAKKTLADLEKMGPTAAGFAGELAAFEKAVLAHADAEETHVLPRLEQGIEPEERQKMALAVLAAEAVAPTHAHKMAPTSATGNLVVGPFVAIVDRVRDAIAEHRRAG